MLTIRQRGKARIFYVRGRVTLGDKTIVVPERSAGTSDRTAATRYKNELERQLQDELMFGKQIVAKNANLADAFAAFLGKPNPPTSSDVLRIGILNDHIGAWTMEDPQAAWMHFRKTYLKSHAPGGQERYRSVLQSAINVYREELGLAKVQIKAIKFDNERVRFLAQGERDLLISCYSPHVQSIIMVLAYQGLRTQEALQLKWGIAGADLVGKRIWLDDTKTKKPRCVPMHPKVEAMLRALWVGRGQPTSGHVFLNNRGKPYADTRKYKIQGGNPLRRAHATACKRARVVNFTVHDWRHHWASHCVMCGIDLPTLQQLGGWKSLRMVMRYAAVSADHMAAAIAKLV